MGIQVSFDNPPEIPNLKSLRLMGCSIYCAVPSDLERGVKMLISLQIIAIVLFDSLFKLFRQMPVGIAL